MWTSVCLLSLHLISDVLSQTDILLPDYGTVTGNEYSTYNEYLGIPYAKAPIPENNLRWQYTQKMDSWQDNGPFLATSYGSGCLQPVVGSNISFDIGGSEDCLYLNIWVPTGSTTDSSSSSSSSSSDMDKSKGKSVMIWFHGGGYSAGSADSFYDGSVIASENGVIVVAFNYRLGALGFLYDDTLGFTGNYGYYDQLFAVNWVYDNIEYFGGNGDDITLFGESAGAQSVASMLLSYDAPSQTDFISVKGKFRAGIMQSTPFSLRQRTPQIWTQVICGLKNLQFDKTLT